MDKSEYRKLYHKDLWEMPFKLFRYLYGKGKSVDGHAGILSVEMNLTMTIKSASILDVNVFDVPVGKQNLGIQAMRPYCPFCEE